MKAVLVKTDGNVEVIDQEWTYNQISTAVGGWIDPVSLDEDYGSTFAYVNEEGKILGMPENAILTNYWYNSGVRILIGDYIAGDAVVFGGIDEYGDNTEVTPEVIAALLKVKERLNK